MIPARQKIIARLYGSPNPVPLHELNIEGVSETAASARLREMAKDGIVESVKVEGKRWTAWRLASKELSLPLNP